MTQRALCYTAAHVDAGCLRCQVPVGEQLTLRSPTSSRASAARLNGAVRALAKARPLVYAHHRSTTVFHDSSTHDCVLLLRPCS